LACPSVMEGGGACVQMSKGDAYYSQPVIIKNRKIFSLIK
jgi:hypothetical protein